MPKRIQSVLSFIATLLLVAFFWCLISTPASAQQASPTPRNRTLLNVPGPDPQLATDPALFASEAARLASPSAEELIQLDTLKKEDITKPEEVEEKSQYFELFSKRPISEPTWYNFLAYSVQSAVQAGVPANTIILIFLVPFLVTIIVLVRHIVGLPTLGILFPIALAITFVATGLFVGAFLLCTIVLGSFISQLLLKHIRIMHLSKLALSNLIISLLIFAVLVIGVSYGALSVKNLSFLPVLLLILLSEQIVALQLNHRFRDTVLISVVSIGLGLANYFILSAKGVQNFILLYPEFILLLIPVNILIGRYFGLRLNEYFRFKSALKNK